MDLWPPFPKKKRSKMKRVEDRISELPSPQNMDLRPPFSKNRVDRISKLPYHLLIQILSLLPTKDAFATCVFSKRWEYLWPSIDHFFFSCKDKSQENFISFVDYVLDHSTCSKIKNFHLNFTHLSKYEEPISRWVSTAVERNVENVVLLSDSCPDDSIYLPDSIYECSSLITLDLTCCYLDKEIIIDWKSLKTLRLNDITLDDDIIVKILSGCPALEILEFFEFSGFRHLEISSSNLKRLKLENCLPYYDSDDLPLVIFGPHIQYLEISGDMYDLRCRLVNVSFVVSAKLTFQTDSSWFDEDPDEHQVTRTLVEDYFHKLSNATELTIGTCFIEVNLERHTFELGYLGFGLPNLKNIKVVSSSMICLKEHLEWDYDDLFKLSEFLLKNATVLEKFVIISRRRICSICSMNCTSQYLARLAEKLEGCPRSSTSSVISCYP